MKKLFCLVTLLLASVLPSAHAQNELGEVSFAILALDVDGPSRRLLENALVERLRENEYKVQPVIRLFAVSITSRPAPCVPGWQLPILMPCWSFGPWILADVPPSSQSRNS